MCLHSDGKNVKRDTNNKNVFNMNYNGVSIKTMPADGRKSELSMFHIM
jgi:hypothetical protein